METRANLPSGNLAGLVVLAVAFTILSLQAIRPMESATAPDKEVP